VYILVAWNSVLEKVSLTGYVCPRLGLTLYMGNILHLYNLLGTQIGFRCVIHLVYRESLEIQITIFLNR